VKETIVCDSNTRRTVPFFVYWRFWKAHPGGFSGSTRKKNDCMFQRIFRACRSRLATGQTALVWRLTRPLVAASETLNDAVWLPIYRVRDELAGWRRCLLDFGFRSIHWSELDPPADLSKQVGAFDFGPKDAASDWCVWLDLSDPGTIKPIVPTQKYVLQEWRQNQVGA